METLILGAVAAATLVSAATAAPRRDATDAPVAHTVAFIALGTNAGAIPRAHRMQPANALVDGRRAILVDAGDGAAAQLAKAGIGLRQVDAVLISHLHFDHIGGLFGVISQRFQMLETSRLSIYGPRGTQATVASLCDAIRAASAHTDLSTYGVKPCQNIAVVEVADGDRFEVGRIRITAAANSHYAASPELRDSTALSFRFDTPDRAIVYTADTGPSGRVETLAKNADLLVAEVLDPDLEVATALAGIPQATDAMKAKVRAHFHRNHLSPADAAALAKRAGAKKLVLTHNAIDEERLPAAGRAISEIFPGPVVFAHDLEQF